MSGASALIHHADLVLRPDPARVVAKLFLPGQEILASGISRADAVLRRVLDLTDQQVSETLADVLASFGSRHADLRSTFAEHYALIAHRLPTTEEPSAQQRDLIGAYCTQEYSVEAAALFNPSMVRHPDQTDLKPDEVRFVMSMRAVGEGHISSIEFRTGVLGAGEQICVGDPGRHLSGGRPSPVPMSRDVLRQALAEGGGSTVPPRLFELLPAEITAADLDTALVRAERERLTRGSPTASINRMRLIASSNYRLDFAPDSPLSQRLIQPHSPDEARGVEDARFTRFIDDDGRVTYYATYTAYDGSHIAPRLLRTRDFTSFESFQLLGDAAKNKGMAIFPRRVDGRYLALSRWDRESIGIAESCDTIKWDGIGTVQAPAQPWELIQLGNCGPPLETPDGWLILTHGVGPMRQYGIGAILLDLDDPTKRIGALTEPLLTPAEDERDGYVPNVVYSCGAMVHGQKLVLPYGCSDSSIRVAFVDLPELFMRLRCP